MRLVQFFWCFDLSFASAKWFVVASVATLDGGDREYLSELTGKWSMRYYELRRHLLWKRCERECLPSERKVPSTGFKESEDAQSSGRNCQVCLPFKPVWICRSLYCDVFPLCMWTLCGESGLIWSGMTFMPSALVYAVAVMIELKWSLREVIMINV